MRRSSGRGQLGCVQELRLERVGAAGAVGLRGVGRLRAWGGVVDRDHSRPSVLLKLRGGVEGQGWKIWIVQNEEGACAVTE